MGSQRLAQAAFLAAVMGSASACALVLGDFDKGGAGASGSGGAGGAATSSHGGATSTASSAAGTGGAGGMTTSTGSTGGGPPSCTGGTPCTAPSDCPTPDTKCLTRTCSMGCCGTESAAMSTACTDNSGAVCDGSGKCVACLTATDCPPQTTECKSNTCDPNLHTCGATDVAKGTTCTDSGGTVCDAMGDCVGAQCTDGVQDGTETDVDCGGSCATKCPDGKKCQLGTDCADKVCDPATKTCSAPTCSDGVQNGSETDVDCGGSCDTLGKTCADLKHCTTNNDCTHTFCFVSGSTGTCVSCTDGAKDGNETGTDCGGAQCDMQGKKCGTGQGCTTSADCAGTPGCSGTVYTPASVCNAADVCVAGTAQTCTSPTGVCNAASGCVQCNVNADCPGPSCSNGMLTPAFTCNASQVCVAGTAGACPGGLVCASGTSCKTACAADSDCEGTGVFCKNPGAAGTCAAKIANGGSCAGNDQCTSGACGLTGSGHCCAATACVIGGACGATDCNGTGACSYPAVACSATSCSGSTLTTYTQCSAGTCTGGPNSNPCGGGLVCGGASCLTSCGPNSPTGDANCQPGYWCNGSGGGACEATEAVGSACNRNGQCASGVCALGACMS